MGEYSELGTNWHRLLLCAIFLFLGFSIFAVPYYAHGTAKVAYEIGAPVVLAVLFLLVRRSGRLGRYVPILFAFLTASVAFSLTTLIARPYSLPSSVQGIAYQKVLDTFLVVAPIIVLTKASGASLGSIMLRRGRLKLGLAIGTATFIFFLLTSVQVSTLLFYGEGLTVARLTAWAPWVLIFVLSNGLREELLFRGLFIEKYRPLVGKSTSNILQAGIFSLPHLSAGYTPSVMVFLVITFLLGLAFGEVIRRTKSLLGSILFHAGADIPVVLGYYSAVS